MSEISRTPPVVNAQELAALEAAEEMRAAEVSEAPKSSGLDSKWCTLSENGKRVIVRLRYPVEHCKITIEAVELRTEVSAGDLERMDEAKGDVAKGLYLAAHLSGLSVSALRKFRAVDFAEVQKVAAYCMGKEPDADA